jgi:biopolymer transport protein ExbB
MSATRSGPGKSGQGRDCRCSRRRYGQWGVSALVALLFWFGPVSAEDMRAASQKAKARYEAAVAEARAGEKQITEDRQALEREIARLDDRVSKLNAEIAARNARLDALAQERTTLSQRQSDEELALRELTGSMRVVARDLETTLAQSLLTALDPRRLDALKPMLDKDHFPGLDDAKIITDRLFEEMALSGEVALRKGSFTDRNGNDVQGDILTVGKFTAAYRTDTETGFLRYAEDSHRLFALSSFPSWSIGRNLKAYMQGGSDDVSLDISGGAALRQITHTNTLMDQIRSGGLLVWPILAIALFALLIAIERLIFLKGVHDNTDRVMGRVNDLALHGRWAECDAVVKERKGRPVYNVLEAGLCARGEDRETLESILQEAILKELPRLERFLPMLNMMGAIAPLLGLLGTVTGMIATFHVITLYGTGDPRMMSGGISEALVTTMLGLAVAIPIMLVHTFLNRRVEHVAGDMEEKAVALTNIIYRQTVATSRQGASCDVAN